MKTGADFLVDELYNFGVRVAFVFTGGAISAIIDSQLKSNGKKIGVAAAESFCVIRNLSRKL